MSYFTVIRMKVGFGHTLQCQQRFSEDLCFLLRKPDPEFVLILFVSGMHKIFAQYGLDLHVHSKNDMDWPIRDAVLKTDSVANQLELTFPGDGQSKAVKIKLAIDTNPPAYPC